MGFCICPSLLYVHFYNFWQFLSVFLYFPLSYFSVCLFTLPFLFNSVQLLSHVRLFATPWITARQASLSITNSRSSLRLRSIESVMPSSHLILCHLLLLLPPIPTSIRVFSNESTLRMRWKCSTVPSMMQDFCFTFAIVNILGTFSCLTVKICLLHLWYSNCLEDKKRGK